MKELTREEMLLVLDERELPKQAEDLLQVCDFRYHVMEGPRREMLVNFIMDRIGKDRQQIGAPARTADWENGWAAQLSECIERGFVDESLIPKFIHNGQPMRVLGEYVETTNAMFEADWVKFLRTWFLAKYFSEMDFIWEFGCGTGHNLLAAARMYPNARCVGLDFSRSAVHLVRQMADRQNVQIEAAQFDMRRPDENVAMPENAGVFTFGSVEQLAGDIKPFLEYLAKNKPRVVVHVEPVAHLYDPDSAFDRLAIQFQQKRGYSPNLIAELKQMEHWEQAQILKVRRTGVGSLFMEGYNVIVWQPIS
jgi:precorrin-6B methylase 2